MDDDRQLTRSASLVAFLTLLSRIMGLIRDAVIAGIFRKKATDVFFVAFTIPNVLRRLTGEGSLTVAFIPVYAELNARQGKEQAVKMLANVLGCALVILAVLTALGMALAPWFVRLFAYGFTAQPEKFELATGLTRIMFAFLFTTGLTALAMGVLNSHQHFISPALAPVVLNVVIISTVFSGGGLISGWGWPPVYLLGYGVVLGGLGQVILQLPILSRYRALPAPRFNFRDPGVVRVGRLMLPSIFALAIYEVNVIIARQFASFLAEGAISYLYYSQRLIEFPMGLFAIAIATVAMPNLSQQAAAGDWDKLKQTYRFALSIVLFIILPATAGLAALAIPLTSVLFQRGQFTHDMSLQTAMTLMGFLCGLWAGAGVRQTVPVFYALQEPQTPVKAAAMSLGVYLGLAWLLYRPLGTLGLALAVAGSSIVNFLTILTLLRLRLGLLGLRSVLRSALKSAVAATVSGFSAYLVAGLGEWQVGAEKWTNLVILVGAVLTGITVYVGCAWLLRSAELGQLVQAFRKKGTSSMG